ncbi:MAG: hypothetical protein AAF078_05920 [Planctomycetota bacterium]
MATGATEAQSNPANFDTVINVPDDQPTFEGFVVGGMQVNVGPGGTTGDGVGVASIFEPFAPAELNILGGHAGDGLNGLNGTFRLVEGSLGDAAEFTDSHVIIEGGTVGDLLTLAGGTFTQTGGVIGNFRDPTAWMTPLTTLREAEVNIQGAEVRSTTDLIEVDLAVSDGVFWERIDLRHSNATISGSASFVGSLNVEGSDVIMTGGHLGNRPNFGDGVLDQPDRRSTFVWSGGRIAGYAEFELGKFEIIGTDFEVHDLIPQEREIVTGRLADGTALILEAPAGALRFGDDRNWKLTRAGLSLPPTPLAQVVTSGTTGEQGLFGGQSLTLAGTASVPADVSIVGSKLLVLDDAVVDGGLEAFGSEVTIRGGRIGGTAPHPQRPLYRLEGITAYAHSKIHVEAGTLFSADIYDSTASLSGGKFERTVRLERSELDISGGEFRGISAFTSDVTMTGGEGGSISLTDATLHMTGGWLTAISARSGGHITLAGGSVDEIFLAEDTDFDLIARKFLIDGQPVTDLLLDTPRLIEDREITITGLYLDGTRFEWQIPQEITSDIRIILIPEPSAVALAAAGLGLLSRRPRRDPASEVWASRTPRPARP